MRRLKAGWRSSGGSSGIGAATALQFAREVAKVAVAARRKDKSEAEVRQIKALGGEGLFVQTDVNKREDISALVRKTARAIRKAGLRGEQFGNRGAGVRAYSGD
jgi:NADP-dependent 3-hydroxy acid dehydrogenase YdfG